MNPIEGNEPEDPGYFECHIPASTFFQVETIGFEWPPKPVFDKDQCKQELRDAQDNKKAFEKLIKPVIEKLRQSCFGKSHDPETFLYLLQEPTIGKRILSYLPFMAMVKLRCNKFLRKQINVPKYYRIRPFFVQPNPRLGDLAELDDIEAQLANHDNQIRRWRSHLNHARSRVKHVKIPCKPKPLREKRPRPVKCYKRSKR